MAEWKSGGCKKFTAFYCYVGFLRKAFPESVISDFQSEIILKAFLMPIQLRLKIALSFVSD